MPRSQKPGLAEVAARAGVSLATVSRALSQPKMLQAETLKRVHEAARELGYKPNRKASALASGRSRTVGVAVPTLNSAIFAEALQEMQRTFYEEGYQLLVASHEYDPLAESVAVGELLSHGVDGLIVVGGERLRVTWDSVEAAGTPLVQMWCGVAAHDCVGIDNVHAGALVAQHLIELGHSRIGVITGLQRHNDRQRLRLHGIRDALSAAGLGLPGAYVSEQPLNVGSGRLGCATLLELSERPTAVIGTVDLLAIGAAIEAQGRGLAVPDDISFAGIDNLEFSAHIAPSLTTVEVPSAEIGARSARHMLDLLRKPGPRGHVTLPVELVVRRSTRPPPCA